MPERPQPKIHTHPRNATESRRADSPIASHHHYAELQITSNFTFLTGASHPEELIEQAARLGHRAVAITDRHTLAGIVRAHVAAKHRNIPLAVGARVDLHHSIDTLPHHGNTNTSVDSPLKPGLTSLRGNRRSAVAEPGSVARKNSSASSTSVSVIVPALSLLLYPTDAASYGRLCRLLTLGKRRAPKGECYLTIADLLEHNTGLLAIILSSPLHSREDDQTFFDTIQLLRHHFTGDRLSLAASLSYDGEDRARLAHSASIAARTNIPMVATNDVYYHHRARRPLQDVITCIRHGCTLDEAGFRLFPNAERCLKSPDEMARLFAEYPKAIARTIEIADRATAFSLDELRYQYPDEICPSGKSAMQHLMDLTWRGAEERFGSDGATKRRRRGGIYRKFRNYHV